MFVLSLLAVAVNLRPALTSVGPLLPEIRRDDLGLGLGVTQAGVLTTAPLLFFALGAPLAPRLARRFGLERTVLAVLAVVALALAARPWGGFALLLLGTAVAAGAIAVANVLVPALIRRELPSRAMAVMGAYSLTLALGATIAAGVTVPIAGWLGGWRWGLASWALLAVVALVLWAPRGRGGAAADLGSAATRQLWRHPLAWQVSAYLGTQSVGFYCVVAWLPSIARESGMTATNAGLLLSTSILVGAGSGLLVPVLSSRARDQRVAAAGMVVFILAGLAGLALAPAAAPWLWAVLLGIGEGAPSPSRSLSSCCGAGLPPTSPVSRRWPTRWATSWQPPVRSSWRRSATGPAPGRRRSSSSSPWHWPSWCSGASPAGHGSSGRTRWFRREPAGPDVPPRQARGSAGRRP
ncbi:MFS transporter [Georgenia thermotolerans]|uniref:MFS transporter n=1 Tax=Georgenia thermotolerans TaxID=527326 RepID=UPI0014793C23|nr:MFS transporter [Georgenia thermotolerans]